MKEDKLLNELFESARTEQPKISYEEMADSFTKTVPTATFVETVKELLLNNINLNSILLVATAGIALTAVLMTNTPSENKTAMLPIEQEVVMEDEVNFPQEEKNSVAEVEVTKEIETTVAPTFEIKKSNPLKLGKKKIIKSTPQKVVIPSTPTVSDKDDNNVITEGNTISLSTETPEEKEPEVKEEIVETRSTLPPAPKKPSRSNVINATNGYGELITGYGTDLKKLKRELASKLVKDGFIESKHDQIIMNISEREVLVNGMKLKPYLYTKYTSIVQDYEIIPDVDRQIRINDDVILVGDFTEKGFRGKGLGKGGQVYVPNFEKEIKIGSFPINIEESPTIVKKGKVSRDELIMQKVLETNYLEKIFRKNAQGNYLPLTLLTNDHFSGNLTLTYKNEAIKLIKGEASLSANEGLPIIFISKYKVTRKKAVVKFLYDGYEVTVSLKPKSTGWEKRRLQVKGKGTNHIDVTF